MPIFRGVSAVSEFQDATVNELEELIEQEAEARQSADATLQGNIDSEASARQSADATLQGNIDSEASARQSADATLQGKIDLKADIESPVFTSNSTESMRLTTLGYLKADPSGSYLNQVGSPTASSTFHSFVSAGTNNLVLYGNGNSTTNLYSGKLNGSGSNHVLAETGTVQVFRVGANGDIFTRGSLVGNSDLKLKENIVNSTPKLEDISKIRFVNFNFKEGVETGRKEFGVIAQEIEEVFPNLVINTPDTEEVETTDEEGNTVKETVETGTVTKSVKYSVLTLLAVKALQELKTEKDELEAKHEELIDEVGMLRRRIEALEAN